MSRDRAGCARRGRWSDIDFAAGSLTVRRALQRLKGQGLVFSEPKSQAGRRTIALPLSLRRGLQAQRDAQQIDRDNAAEAWQEHDLVFAQPDGRPIDPGADWKAWKALLKRAVPELAIEAAARMEDALWGDTRDPTPDVKPVSSSGTRTTGEFR